MIFFLYQSTCTIIYHAEQKLLQFIQCLGFFFQKNPILDTYLKLFIGGRISSWSTLGAVGVKCLYL